MPSHALRPTQDLASLVLGVMGLPPGAAEPRHSLADMGIDSMQQARTDARNACMQSTCQEFLHLC